MPSYLHKYQEESQQIPLDPIYPMNPTTGCPQISREAYVEFKDSSPITISSTGALRTVNWRNYQAKIDRVYLEFNDFDETWCSITTQNPLSATLRINESHKGTERKVTLVIDWHNIVTGVDFKSSLDIIQEKGEPYFLLDTDTVNISYEQQTVNIPLTAYTEDIEVTSNVSWLTPTINTPLTNIAIQATVNNDVIERTGIITVTSNEYSEIITVIQSENKEKPNIYFEPETLTINNNIGDIFYIYFNEVNGDTLRRLTLGFNINYTANIDRTNNRIKIEVIKQNNTKEANTTTILAQGGEMSRLHTLTVKQPSMYDVHFEPNELRFKADGTPYSTDFTFLTIPPSDIMFYEWIETETPDWYELTWNDKTNQAKVGYILQNDSPTERRFTETIQVTLQNDVDIRCDVTIIQDGVEPFIENPIWKDTLYTFERKDYTTDTYYRLVINGYEAYRGKIYFVDDTCIIRINNIVNDYIDVLDNPFLRIYNDNNAYVDVMLQVSINQTDWNDLQHYYFYYDYSYEEVISKDVHSLTKPIQNYIDKRCYFLYTMQDYYTEAKTTNAEVRVFDKSGFEEYNTSIRNKQFTWCIPLNNDTDLITIDVDGGSSVDNVSVDVIDTCKEYCLYYLQPNGGWCWYVINGKTVKKDNITSNYITRNVNNSFTQMFQKVKYLLQKKTSYELNTDYLSDEQSELFTQIFSSPVVYLHDLRKDKIISVNITDSNVDYRTFKNQGRKFARYTINVEESQMKYIKG